MPGQPSLSQLYGIPTFNLALKRDFNLRPIVLILTTPNCVEPAVLAQNEYLDDPDFVAYLKYLLYWKKPEYAKFIVFPHALSFLHLLQEAPFRENLKRGKSISSISGVDMNCISHVLLVESLCVWMCVLWVDDTNRESPLATNCRKISADFYMMLHQQQGFQWQFAKTMRLRSETMNGSNGGEKREAQPQGGEPTEATPNLGSAGGAAADASVGKPNVADPKAGAPATTGVQGTAA